MKVDPHRAVPIGAEQRHALLPVALEHFGVEPICIGAYKSPRSHRGPTLIYQLLNPQIAPELATYPRRRPLV